MFSVGVLSFEIQYLHFLRNDNMIYCVDNVTNVVKMITKKTQTVIIKSSIEIYS